MSTEGGSLNEQAGRKEAKLARRLSARVLMVVRDPELSINILTCTILSQSKPSPGFGCNKTPTLR